MIYPSACRGQMSDISASRRPDSLRKRSHSSAARCKMLIFKNILSSPHAQESSYGPMGAYCGWISSSGGEWQVYCGFGPKEGFAQCTAFVITF